MKTAVVISRDLNGYSIRQDSSDGFFNANDLIDLYNKEHNELKRVQDYLDNESTRRLASALIIDLQNNAKERDYENGVIRTKRGKNGGTWFHPYMMIDFGMWLSPEFKITIIRWFYDNVISLRNDCGDSFLEVNKALFDQDPKRVPAHFEYSNEANMINKLTFGTSDKGQRNFATEQQLVLLKALQKSDVQFIKQGLDYHDRYDKLKKVKELYLLTI